MTGHDIAIQILSGGAGIATGCLIVMFLVRFWERND